MPFYKLQIGRPVIERGEQKQRQDQREQGAQDPHFFDRSSLVIRNERQNQDRQYR